MASRVGGGFDAAVGPDDHPLQQTRVTVRVKALTAARRG